jgi:hypothetical protein
LALAACCRPGAALRARSVGLATSRALPVQIVAAAAGALVATAGAALARLGWPRRRRSDVHHLLTALGFFMFCAGVVAMLAGVGLYH